MAKNDARKMGERDRVQGMLALMEQAWRNFHQRRSFEWKFSLGIWAALGLLSSQLLTAKELPTLSTSLRYVTIGAGALLGVLIFLAHCYWLGKARKRTEVDQRIAIEYERRIQKLLDCLFDDALARKCERLRYQNRGWSERVQLIITVLLALAAWLVLILKLPVKP